MKKKMIILMTILMIVVSACSSPSGGIGGNNGNKGNEQTNTLTGKEEKTTSSPKNDMDEKKKNKEKKTIVFSTFFHGEFFQEAKRRYEAKNPHITIDLRVVETNDENGQEKEEEFRKTTATAMLSGKGPDMLEMDRLPVEHYVGKKLLANLGDMIDKDPTFKKEQYFGNILDGIKLNGGLYSMPTGFFLHGLMGNETMIEKSGVKIDDSSWDWSDFASIVKEIAKKSDKDITGVSGLLMGYPPELMLGNLVKDQYATFVDQESGKAKFDSAVFTDLLKEVKQLKDEKIVGHDTGQPVFIEVQINSPETYVEDLKGSEYNTGEYKHKSKLYAKPNGNGQEAGGFFRVYQTVGINEKSEVKEEAWDFLKFISSEEMQDKASSSGFSINKASYAWAAKEALKKGKVESVQPFGPLKGAKFDITQKDINELQKFLENAKYPVDHRDSKVNQIIMEESKAYFAGQKSPEAVAKLIQNRVTTVLNE